ncbi:MAG: hypothetical protein IT307_15650 [Chloroflexi bacterium]|nr:hypothetical protein [Chloroflexota bacterium]
MSSYNDVRPHVFGPLAPLGAPARQRTPATEAPVPAPPDLEAVVQAAAAEGFQKGYEDGLSLVREEQRKAMRRLVDIARSARLEAERFTRSLESQVVELSLVIAQRIVEREVRLDPAIVLPVVRAALQEIADAAELRLRVNPVDHPLVSAHWAGLATDGLIQRCELVADERVEPAGCVLETGIGQIDAQLPAKLEQVGTILRAVLDGELL